MILVEGTDRYDFLQGLITQDITLLKPGLMLYSAFLTPQGKYLADFFITEKDGIIGLEGYEPQMQDVLKKLNLHKLRSDVTLSLAPAETYVSFTTGDYKDPRHNDMGYRSYTRPQGDETDIDAYHKKRICLAIPEAGDMEAGQSSPFEGNLDRLHAISFSKGCYMGQELVSRIHHRGLVKRRLQPVTQANGEQILELQKT